MNGAKHNSLSGWIECNVTDSICSPLIRFLQQNVSHNMLCIQLTGSQVATVGMSSLIITFTGSRYDTRSGGHPNMV